MTKGAGPRSLGMSRVAAFAASPARERSHTHTKLSLLTFASIHTCLLLHAADAAASSGESGRSLFDVLMDTIEFLRAVTSRQRQTVPGGDGDATYTSTQ